VAFLIADPANDATHQHRPRQKNLRTARHAADTGGTRPTHVPRCGRGAVMACCTTPISFPERVIAGHQRLLGILTTTMSR
jgi:hypothetical protein